MWFATILPTAALALFAPAVSTQEDLRIVPGVVRLVGSDARAQLRVDDGEDVDRTADAVYESRDPAIARIEPGGLVIPVSDGRAEIVARLGGRTSRAVVVVRDTANAEAVSFDFDVVPILTRIGCNSGACHGKSIGQNGFRLSLLGFDPASDHEAITREGRGRRILPGAPGDSLLLRKPTAQVPHGGGRRIEPDSPEFRTIARWIRQGAGRGGETRPPVTSIRVEPAVRVVVPGRSQQLRVVARDAGGREADVTRLAVYQSNAPEIAEPGASGLIRTQGGVGEAAILARFGGHLAVARVVVPHPTPRRSWASPASTNPIDPLVFNRLRDLGLEPSPACTDAEFARRSTLAICGILPEPEAVVAFENERHPEKRTRWVERLLDRPEYADLFAMKWSAILRNKRSLGQASLPSTFAFHGWIRQAIAENLPYDRFVEAILTAQGDVAANPPVAWYRTQQTAEERADDVAQLFLGQRIQCARCHHHPSERWDQDDYYGFASIFSRVGSKPGFDPTAPRVFVASEGLAVNPVTGRPIPPRPLGGPDLAAADPRADPRAGLVAWLRRADNPFFARAVVNRYWTHFLGRGLVEPEDDMRVSNPPSNPEVLDALSDAFVRSGYDLKWLVRTIATSKVYDRSSLPNDSNRSDRRNFARYAPRRLPAEVLLDAINVVTGAPEPFPGLPPGTRAVQLPDDGFASEFLDVFGRPRRETVCECERSAGANLSQTLLLLNSEELQRKLSEETGRAASLASDADRRDDATKVRELYRVAYSRDPDPDELSECLVFLSARRERKQLKQGYEDLIWALLNSKEFLFE